MTINVEYMCKDVSGEELGQLGNLISSLEQQGWQTLDAIEAQYVPAMFAEVGSDACCLWMKRPSAGARRAAA